MHQTKNLITAFLLLFMIVSCNNSGQEELTANDNTETRFLLMNNTGHTLPPNSNLEDCGDGITVTFELNSATEINEKVMIADHLKLAGLKIDKGQPLTVRILDESGNVLASRTTLFGDIDPNAGMQDFHLISFCNDINFNF